MLSKNMRTAVLQVSDYSLLFQKIYGLTLLERSCLALDRGGFDIIYFDKREEIRIRNILAKRNDWKVAFLFFEDFEKELRGRVERAFIFDSLFVIDHKFIPELKTAGKNCEAIVAIKTQKDIPKAKKYLIQSLTKSHDGWVSRNLNRPISTKVSSILSNYGITPNQFTILNGIVGLAAAYFMFLGGYWNWLIAGFILQLNSILDGVDGELARLKFKGSPLGQKLDTFFDHLVNMSSLVALYLSVIKNGLSPLYQYLGILALAFTLLAMLNLTIYLIRFAPSYSFYVNYQFKNPLIAKIMKGLAIFARHDFYILSFFILSILGLMPWTLFYVMVMAGVILILSLQHHLKANRNSSKLDRGLTNKV